MNIELSLIEAKTVLSKVQSALKSFRGNGRYEFNESECQLRYAAIEMLLIMAENDIQDMVNSWHKDYISELKKKSEAENE